jgi:hypothetical protein
MKDKEKFDEVCKWCDQRRWSWSENGGGRVSEMVELSVSCVWIFEHADELRKEAGLNGWPQDAVASLEELIEEGRAHNSRLELRANHGEKASAFFLQIARLKADWTNFKLFRNSRAFARQFSSSHRLIASSLFDSAVLQLTRLLTDGTKVGRHKVLTIDTLAEEILDAHSDKGIKTRFLSRIKQVKESRIVQNLKNEWRHNRLAHNNYDAALQSSVPSVKFADVDKAIEEFVAIFQDIGKELNNSYDMAVEHLTIPSFAEGVARIGLDQLAQPNAHVVKV